MNTLVLKAMKKVCVAFIAYNLCFQSASAQDDGEISLAQISVGQTYSNQSFNLSGAITSVAPSGKLVSVSANIFESGQLTIDHVDWQTERIERRLLTTELDAHSTALTYTHFFNQWTLSANYTYWRSKQSQSLADQLIAEQTINTPSYGMGVSYSHFVDNWHISPGFTLQLNHYQTRELDEERTFNLAENESLLASALLQAAYIKPLAQQQYLMLGTLIRINSVFYGDSAKRRSGPQFDLNQRNSAGDDELFAELSLFLSYDLNKNWSLELDSSVLLDDLSSHSVAWRLGYRF
jgi:hypothetical protein